MQSNSMKYFFSYRLTTGNNTEPRERTYVHNSSSVGVLIYLFGLIVKNGKVYAEEEEEEEEGEEENGDDYAQTSHDDASAVPEQAFDVS